MPWHSTLQDVCSPEQETAATFLPSPAKIVLWIYSRPAPPKSPPLRRRQEAGFTFRPAISAKCFCWADPAQSEGSYQSDVFDGKVFSRWGRAELRGSRQGGRFLRAAEMWTIPTATGVRGLRWICRIFSVLNVPPARFIQWKAVLHAGNPAPSVDSVLLNYLPKNVAPDFDDVSVQVGVRYQPLPKPVGIPDASGGSGTPPIRFDAPPPSTCDADSIGAKWTVHDDNDDQMVYSVFYRGDGETRWLLLKEGLTDEFYSFDASLLPDGGYTVEVVVGCAVALPGAGAHLEPGQRPLRSRHHAAAN